MAGCKENAGPGLGCSCLRALGETCHTLSIYLIIIINTKNLVGKRNLVDKFLIARIGDCFIQINMITKQVSASHVASRSADCLCVPVGQGATTARRPSIPGIISRISSSCAVPSSSPVVSRTRAKRSLATCASAESLPRPWKKKDSRLVLENGSVLHGIGFGATGTILGEVGGFPGGDFGDMCSRHVGTRSSHLSTNTSFLYLPCTHRLCSTQL